MSGVEQVPVTTAPPAGREAGGTVTPSGRQTAGDQRRGRGARRHGRRGRHGGTGRTVAAGGQGQVAAAVGGDTDHLAEPVDGGQHTAGVRGAGGRHMSHGEGEQRAERQAHPGAEQPDRHLHADVDATGAGAEREPPRLCRASDGRWGG
ncbi:hypothetical protein ACFV2H_43885 [Streptomyces sp. NPDC059629]|uniref:hypothetical protein n=1 Tax=Streptomyces sp. NPDC059629 TaxID=3346889 RepID=UPI00369B12C7